MNFILNKITYKGITEIQNSIKTFKIGQILQKKCAIFARGFVIGTFLKSCVGRTTNFEARVQNYFNIFVNFHVKFKSLCLTNLLDILQKS